MGYFIIDDVEFGGVNAQSANGTSYDNTQSGSRSTQVQGAVDQLYEEIANQKVSQEFSFTKTITAGTIGTRDSALTLNVGKSGYVPRSYEIIEIDGSSNASVQVVRNGSDKNTAAILFYRATSNGGNMSGKIRVEYDKA